MRVDNGSMLQSVWGGNQFLDRYPMLHIGRTKIAIDSGLSESDGNIKLDRRHIRRGFCQESNLGFINGFERCTAAMHRRAIEDDVDLWRGEHKVDWAKLSPEQRYNYTVLFLIGNLCRNLDNMEDTTLPKYKRGNMDACTAYYCEEEGLEHTVRYGIEYAWRNRQTFRTTERTIPLPKDLNEIVPFEDSLEWERITAAALDAVYSSGYSLGEVVDDENGNVLEMICQRIYEHAVYHRLFGDDTENYRISEYGHPQYFSTMSRYDRSDNQRLNGAKRKENIILIALSTLSAISDYMIMVPNHEKARAVKAT